MAFQLKLTTLVPDPITYKLQCNKFVMGSGTNVVENASYLDSMSDTMTIPANDSGTYFSFDCFDTANPGALQVPHDAFVRVEFDTLQIIYEIDVPYGNWGKSPYLEPVTKDFPQFGPGGATQVITHSEIHIDSITKLPK